MASDEINKIDVRGGGEGGYCWQKNEYVENDWRIIFYIKDKMDRKLDAEFSDLLSWFPWRI